MIKGYPIAAGDRDFREDAQGDISIRVVNAVAQSGFIYIVDADNDCIDVYNLRYWYLYSRRLQ